MSPDPNARIGVIQDVREKGLQAARVFAVPKT